MVLFCEEISWQIFELKLVSPVPFFFLKEGAKRRKSRIHVPFFSDRNICNCNMSVVWSLPINSTSGSG